MNQEAYIIAPTHSVAVLYTYWNYEGMLLTIPVFKTGRVSIKIKDKTRQDLIHKIPGHHYTLNRVCLITLLHLI